MKYTKTRGLDINTGEVVYGTAIYFPSDFCVIAPLNPAGKWLMVDPNGKWHIVDPDSLAPLIGIDARGTEIYDGDIVDYYYEYDEDGLEQEYPISADLSVTFNDENGNAYSRPKRFKAML